MNDVPHKILLYRDNVSDNSCAIGPRFTFNISVVGFRVCLRHDTKLSNLMCVAISQKIDFNVVCIASGTFKSLVRCHLKNSSSKILSCDRDDLFTQDFLDGTRTDQSASFAANFIIIDLRPSI